MAIVIEVKSKLKEIEEKIMSGLKDFQQATVNRIDCLFRDGQKRVLVSDEVGLGKTLIARGTIAKLAVMQKENNDELVKVVYICSNATIAEQNLSKLRITSEVRTEAMNSSRLSMQHLNIFKQENDKDLLNSYIQLIPLTPSTSFNITSGAGKYEERALMFVLLSKMQSLQKYLGELELLLQNTVKDWSWNQTKEWYEREVAECNNTTQGGYLGYMLKAINDELYSTIIEKESLAIILERACENIKKGLKINNNKLIGKLRVMFAKISINRLNPDLIIMDEFQRFKYLIEKNNYESEMDMLAHDLFSSNNTKMLLLSATPYKMYSTLEEVDGEEGDVHYSEFLSVMNFLNNEEEKNQRFKDVWNNYSLKLKEFSAGDTSLLVAKDEAEEAMYGSVCRTERISAPENSDIIKYKETLVDVMEQDIKSYISAQKLIKEIGATYNVPIDYIKSTPYLLSFMRDYQLKQNIEKYFKLHPTEISKVKKTALWIDEKKIDKYERVPSGNARLEVLKQHAFEKNAESLLWVPPTKPYYESKGPFKDVERFSKVLVFSSWEMVPRMIAGMLSYEAERKTVGDLARKIKEDVRYFYTDNASETAKRKRFPSPRLNFAVKEGQANAMSLFCLIYPSKFLTNCYNPIECLNKGLSLREIEELIKTKIEQALIPLKTTDDGVADDRWYYMAPMLLDEDWYYNNWIAKVDNLSDGEDAENSKKNIGFEKHVQTLREINKETLGKMPDGLVELLTDIALASPAVCINRTYSKYAYGENAYDSIFASKIARLFINRMNTPESIAIIELCYGLKNTKAHWRNLLTYCKDGNLQAMFDEYAHLITNGLDKDNNTIKWLHNIISESMSIRTTLYNIDTYESFKRVSINGKNEKIKKQLRTHFAVAFTKGDSESNKSIDRKKILRNAFNSPFRPFVLASTSIGQEGLDFHNYCRKIVHWNLPSNPIDLEQREGRINRFECLAIRQNIAERYGNNRFEKDIWKEMFEIAVRDTKEKNQHSSDLIPFWGVPETEDMVKIERIVPMYPFSKDISAYERMIKILLHYRLTLGQARQEELLEYIVQNTEDGEELKKFFINLSPKYKKID